MRRVYADEADSLLFIDVAGMDECFTQRTDVYVAVDVIEPKAFGFSLKQ